MHELHIVCYIVGKKGKRQLNAIVSRDAIEFQFRYISPPYSVDLLSC
jgi:hypothetical protein